MWHIVKTGDLPTTEELSKKVDHVCRSTSCWNPEHTRRLTGKENNALKDKAGKLEKVIISGQVFYWLDLLETMPWLEHTMVSREIEQPEKVISTRIGPFALRVASPDQALVYGQRLGCDAYDSLRPFGKSNYFPKSRAEPFKPVKDNMDLFPKLKYKKKKLPTQKEVYEAQRS